MKIVHVEDFIHPDAGYQLNLLAPLQRAQGHEVTIVTAQLDKVPTFLTTFFGRDNMAQRDARFESETGVKILRLPLVGFYSGRAIFSPKLFKHVSALRPDVVFVHGEDTLTGMAFILLSRWLRYPLVFDCHMLEMASLNRFREYFRWFYRTFITPILMREKIPLIRVVDSDFVQKCLGIPLSYTKLLSFGTDTRFFCPSDVGRKRVRSRHGVGNDDFLVIYAGKLDVHKGGKLLAAALAPRLFTDNSKPIKFVVIGNADGDYGEEVERILASSENTIIRLPTLPYRDLAEYYQAADLAIFPRQCSMSFFEVQSCGVPVLFERNEINSQRALSGSSHMFEPESVEDFRRRIVELAAASPEVHQERCRDSRQFVLENYDYVPIAQKFTDVMEEARLAWRAKGRRTYG